jgi:hypothetical protein
MIGELLIAALQRHFPERRFVVGSPPDPVATYKAAHRQVGDLTIYDDGAEATVDISEITHGHFGPYDGVADAAENARRVVDEVVWFVTALFDDRVLLWKSVDHGAGGWEVLEQRPATDPPDQDAMCFVWSGPLTRSRGTAG